MLTRCLVCATPFPPNELLEHLPNGVRIAYDAGRGRLWGICRHCQRWSLVPIEARWEALDELEKIVSDRARLLSDITKVLSDVHVNILAASLNTSRDRVAKSRFTFEMADPKHLGHVLKAVRSVDGVFDAYRVTQ